MPRIAVTPCKRPKDYDAAVRRAGAEPWVPSLADDPAAVVRQVDGVLLTGGDDVDPAWCAKRLPPTCRSWPSAVDCRS
jgi:gamma-glutamyl-gamma-aminobutyrate hydrolase PuuD